MDRKELASVPRAFFHVLLFFSILRVPNLNLTYTHDSSSQFLIESLFARGYFSGIDYIQNVGYLGFLSYPEVFYPPLFWTKIAFVLISTIMLTVAYVFIANHILRGAFKVLFLLWLALITNWDSILYLFYFSVGFYAMHQYAINDRLSVWVVFPAFIIALLFAFAKGTGFYIGAGLIIIIAMGSFNNRYTLSLLLGMAIFSLGACWIFGVGIADIYQYLRANSLFSQMYLANLGSEPSFKNFVIPILLVCSLFGQICFFFKGSVNLKSFICVGYLLGVVAVCFLHSTIRADEHLVVLLNLSVGASLLFAGTYCNHDKVDS